MTTFIFPGQGAQYVGMGKEVFEAYPVAMQSLQEAEEILQRDLKKLIFEGPNEALMQTRNSQVTLFVTSLAILRAMQKEFPGLTPTICAGLSLGEYSALVAAGKLSFGKALKVVDHRGKFMNDACEASKGTMAVVLGLSAEEVETMVSEINLPNDLWAANFNCPGQVVLSGTAKGIEAGATEAKNRGAKRVLPLQVHGAFHSGLMQPAKEMLTPYIQELSFQESETQIVMNVPGGFVSNESKMRQNLIDQVTSPVRWQQGIEAIEERGESFYFEIGAGKTLSGMNRKIGVKRKTIAIEQVDDFKKLEEVLDGSRV